MQTKDYSKEMYDKYYNSKGKTLQIFLKDGSMLEGFLVGFFHGDTRIGEPYVIKWHFVNKNDIAAYSRAPAFDGEKKIGRIIEQVDIKTIKFK